jgi:type II secretory pathway pseudopilin PulG
MKGPIIVAAIFLGIPAIIAIPNFTKARNRSRQGRTMADMRYIATAWEARATDFNRYDVGGPAVAVTSTSPDFAWRSMSRVQYGDLKRVLVPTYIKVLPERDGWGNRFELRAGKEMYAIRSLGSDGKADVLSFASAATTSFEDDIVYMNGTFLRYPEGGG